MAGKTTHDIEELKLTCYATWSRDKIKFLLFLLFLQILLTEMYFATTVLYYVEFSSLDVASLVNQTHNSFSIWNHFLLCLGLSHSQYSSQNKIYLHPSMLWSQVNISESTIPYIDCIRNYMTHNSDFVHHGCLTVRPQANSQLLSSWT